MSKEYILVQIKFPNKDKLENGLTVPSEWVVYNELSELKNGFKTFKDKTFDGIKFEVTIHYMKESE